MELENFYLILPSNSSINYFPGNTTACYSTKLVNQIHLSGEWEVGLKEITFPKTWIEGQKEKNGTITLLREHAFQLKKSTDQSLLFDDFSAAVPSLISPNSFHFITTVHFSPSSYSTSAEIVLDLNRDIFNRLVEYKEKLKFGGESPDFRNITTFFKYHQQLNKVQLTINQGWAVTWTEELGKAMGFDYTPKLKIPARKEEIMAAKISKLETEHHSIYIYTDIVSCVPVGDVEAPLLKIVDTKGHFPSTQTRNYKSIQYVPLQKRLFDSLEIHIKDDKNLFIPFESGSVIITLHFRRRQLT